MIRKNFAPLVLIITLLILLAGAASAVDTTANTADASPALARVEVPALLGFDREISDVLRFGFEFNFENRFSPESIPLTGNDPCAKYYGKGYCVDWVLQRSGRKQSGDASAWRGNISDVRGGRIGDAASQARITHVSVIEGFSYAPNTSNLNGYIVSEMNYGPSWTDRPCLVTNKFGVVTRRIVPLAAITGIWRP